MLAQRWNQTYVKKTIDIFVYNAAGVIEQTTSKQFPKICKQNVDIFENFTNLQDMPNYGTLLPYLESQWKIHSNKYKHA